jgi:hypothetical protein
MAETWLPSPISIDSSFSQSGEIAKDPLTLKFLLGHEFAQSFVATTPEEITTVTIFEGNFGDVDDEYLVAWKGRVVDSTVDQYIINLSCESLFSQLKRTGLSDRFSKRCRHTLYRRGCNLDEADFAVAAVCSAASFTVLTVAEAAVEADGHWVGGMLKGPDGSFRMIISHAGDQITISYPMPSLTGADDDIFIYPGCRHNREDCYVKFDNIANNGSFAWVPDINPFGGTAIG